jgi:aryl-alcohol dehydrogenase-like predicted oxidoreductase
MGMSEFYGTADEEESVATIHQALDAGISLLDTADMYGPFKNEELVERVKRIAAGKGVSAGQLALAWVLAQGKDIVPIPGTTRRSHLEQNIAAVDLDITQSDLSAIAAAMPPGVASGMRYPEEMMRLVNL